MADKEYLSYRHELGDVLRRQDARALQSFLVANATRFGDERQVADVQQKSLDDLEELMHRMTLARPDLADLHRASREWLFQRGIDTYGSDGSRRN